MAMFNWLRKKPSGKLGNALISLSQPDPNRVDKFRGPKNFLAGQVRALRTYAIRNSILSMLQFSRTSIWRDAIEEVCGALPTNLKQIYDIYKADEVDFSPREPARLFAHILSTKFSEDIFTLVAYGTLEYVEAFWRTAEIIDQENIPKALSLEQLVRDEDWLHESILRKGKG